MVIAVKVKILQGKYAVFIENLGGGFRHIAGHRAVWRTQAEGAPEAETAPVFRAEISNHAGGSRLQVQLQSLIMELHQLMAQYGEGPSGPFSRICSSVMETPVPLPTWQMTASLFTPRSPSRPFI